MAGIIKAGHPRSDALRTAGAAYELEDFGGRAEAHLAAIRQQAARILEEARQQAARIRQQAEQEGQQAAQQRALGIARQALDDRLQTLIPALEQAIIEIQQLRVAWIQRWESSAIHLSKAIAERIVRRELRADPEITSQWIREALEMASGQGRIQLQLNPDDHATLGDRLPLLLGRLDLLGATEVIADPAVSPGGCRVVTEFGQIDQRLEAQLARVEEELNS